MTETELEMNLGRQPADNNNNSGDLVKFLSTDRKLYMQHAFIREILEAKRRNRRRETQRYEKMT